MTKLRPGIRCFHKTKDFAGTVVRVEKDFLIVEDEFGFTERFPLSDCLADEQNLMQHVGVYTPWQKGDKRLPSQKSKTEILDLHIEKLNPRMAHASAHDILTYQLKQSRHFIRLMKQRKTKRFKIITGMGSGKLHREVMRLLRQEGFQDFRDENYGGGAIVING